MAFLVIFLLIYEQISVARNNETSRMVISEKIVSDLEPLTNLTTGSIPDV